MTLEAFFEDLEASLNRTCPINAQTILANANQFSITTQKGRQYNLVAPIVAIDFIAGLDEQTADWLCIRKSQIAELRFNSDENASLPLLRHRKSSLEQFLAQMTMPISVAIKSATSVIRFATLIAVSDGLLFLRTHTEQQMAIGTETIEFLRIIETADKNNLQDWQSR